MSVSKIEAQKKCVKDGGPEKVWSKMAAEKKCGQRWRLNALDRKICRGKNLGTRALNR